MGSRRRMGGRWPGLPWLLGLVAQVVSGLAADVPPVTFSVRAAVLEALARNADLEAAAWRLEQSRSDLAAADAAFRPQLGLEVGVLKGDAPSAYLVRTIDARQLGPATDFNRPGGFDNLQAALGLRVTLWDAGRRSLARQQAEAGVTVGDRARQVVVNDLVRAVVHACYQLLAAREYAEATAESSRTVAAELAEAQVRERGGGALRADVLSLEVRLAESRQREIQAENAAALASAALARLLDRDPEALLWPQGEEWEPVVLPPDFQAGRDLALRIRPELEALEGQLRAADRGVAARRAATRPRLDLEGRYWVADDGGQLDLGRDNWTVGAAFTWDLLDGGARAARVRQARDQLAEAQARKRSLEAALTLEVRQAYLGLSEATSRHRVAEANVARAEEGLRLVRSQFTGGAASVTRYLQAEEDRTRARLGEIQARYDLKKAKATVGHAVGLCGRGAEEAREEP